MFTSQARAGGRTLVEVRNVVGHKNVSIFAIDRRSVNARGPLSQKALIMLPAALRDALLSEHQRLNEPE